MKKNRKRAQISKIINEREVTTKMTEIQSIISYCYEELYINKMGNQEEMDKFPEMFNLQGLKNKQNINRPITSNKIESIIKGAPNKQAPGPGGSTDEFHQALQEELIPILLKLYQKKLKGNLISSQKASITLIPKPAKDTTRKKNYRP